MKLFDIQHDHVIRSAFLTGSTNYADALERLFPLIDRFEEQRKLQRPRFYERLKKDIVAGCIMPAVTLAFVDMKMANEQEIRKFEDYIRKNIESGYILDGMQRLNTLKSASEEPDFDGGRPLLINVIVAEKYDLLLYRMITLNNGQKPMTVRHQVEMLTGNLVDRMLVDHNFNNINILREKDTEQNSPKGSFRMADVASAYLAFLTGSPHNQNSRFIEEKLDEILVGKVMDSGLTAEGVNFSDVLLEVDRVSSEVNSRDWLRNDNNLIGFTLGLKKSLDDFKRLDAGRFSEVVNVFELAFQAINPSKVNVGKFRRELSAYFIENIAKVQDNAADDLTEKFFELTAN